MELYNATICFYLWSLCVMHKAALEYVLDHLGEQQIKDMIKMLRAEKEDEIADILALYYNNTYTKRIPALLRPRFA